MANMPGFAEASAMIRAHGIQDRIGVHLNLSDGRPLTDDIRHCPRLCNAAGELRRAPGSIWRLAVGEARAIEIELGAQIEAVLAVGIGPSHFDSHQHFHTRWPVCTVVMRLARRYGVPAIRLSRNCGLKLGWLKRPYKIAFNTRLARAGFARTERFGSARDSAALGHCIRTLEVMTHPDLDTDGRLVDVTTGAGPLEDAARHWGAGGTLVSYRQLCES